MKYVNPLPKMVVLMQFSDVLMTVVNKATRLLLELAVLCYPRYDWIIILRDLKPSFFIASTLSKLNCNGTKIFVERFWFQLLHPSQFYRMRLCLHHILANIPK